jgi:hypothetical protein
MVFQSLWVCARLVPWLILCFHLLNDVQFYRLPYTVICQTGCDIIESSNLARISVTIYIQGGSNMTGTNCDLFTHKQSRSYLNHLVYVCVCVHLLAGS